MQKNRAVFITPKMRLSDLQPSIPGYTRFIGTYFFGGEKNATVDTGPTSAIPNLLLRLAELDITPEWIDYIILTHIHIDHAGGVGTALRRMPNAKVLAHARARSHLIDPTMLWEAATLTSLGLRNRAHSSTLDGFPGSQSRSGRTFL